jgi:hypothetical protein
MIEMEELYIENFGYIVARTERGNRIIKDYKNGNKDISRMDMLEDIENFDFTSKDLKDWA